MSAVNSLNGFNLDRGRIPFSGQVAVPRKALLSKKAVQRLLSMQQLMANRASRPRSTSSNPPA